MFFVPTDHLLAKLGWQINDFFITHATWLLLFVWAVVDVKNHGPVSFWGGAIRREYKIYTVGRYVNAPDEEVYSSENLELSRILS